MVVQKKKRGIYVWPRRNGKDLVAINILAAKAMQRVGLYFYMAPYYTQVRSAIWNGTDGQGRRFLDYIPSELITNKNKAELTITLINGSMIRFCGSDNIDTIVGNNPVGIIFTEFSLHKPEAWHYLRPILAENGGWALFNGTPRGLNHMHSLFMAAKTNPEWFHQFLTRDQTGVPTLEAIAEDRQSGMPESLIQQEYYCSWAASSEETMIPLDIITPAIDHPIQPVDFKHEPRIMSVDPAYAAKGDEATIGKRQGRLFYPVQAFQGLDNMGFATRISKEIKEWRPDVVFIDQGRGEGVISRLEQMGHRNIIPVNFGGTPSTEIYVNKRTEMYGKTKDWLLNPGCTPSLPDDEKLIAELSAPTFELNEKRKITLESKKHMKSRGIPSGGRADALALTFAEEVEIPLRDEFGIDVGILNNQRQFANGASQYNPTHYFQDAEEHAQAFTPTGWIQ